LVATASNSTGAIEPTRTRHGESVAQSDRVVVETREANNLSPHELIARGQYQRAADEIIKRLKEPGGAGMSSERAVLLSNLGMVQNKLGRYAEAENTLEKALQIWKALGQTEAEKYARTLNNLANVFLNQRRYAKAEEMFKEALTLFRNTSSESFTDIGLTLSNLGLTAISLRRFTEAEEFFQQAMTLQRTSQETTHLAITLNNLALAYKLQGRLCEAARTYIQAVRAWEANLGYVPPEVAVAFHNLAMVESALGQTDEAERHFKQALETVNTSLPPEHPTRIAILSGYADLLKKVGRKREAKQFQALARAMRAQHDHENFQDLTVSVEQIAR
jgi:tetratricopeptide (TPR) repeat protein